MAGKSAPVLSLRMVLDVAIVLVQLALGADTWDERERSLEEAVLSCDLNIIIEKFTLSCHEPLSSSCKAHWPIIMT